MPEAFSTDVQSPRGLLKIPPTQKAPHMIDLRFASNLEPVPLTVLHRASLREVRVVTLSALGRPRGGPGRRASSIQHSGARSGPAWIYEGALLFVTDISCNHRDFAYKTEWGGIMTEGPRLSRPRTEAIITAFRPYTCGRPLREQPQPSHGVRAPARAVRTASGTVSFSTSKRLLVENDTFPMALSLSGEGPRGRRRGATGSGGTPGTPRGLAALF
jgi:hypothetical protein